MYFLLLELHGWGKRSAHSRRRFVQRFLSLFEICRAEIIRQKGFFMSLLPYIRNEIPGLREALDAYTFPEILLDVDRYGKGHINDTFCAVCQSQEGNAIRFIIQRLSNAAFPHPEELMENFVRITSFLRNKILADGGDPTRETLSVVKTKDGRDFYTDAYGRVWRLMPFIENTDCYQSAGSRLC